jgi:hypothetical protein
VPSHQHGRPQASIKPPTREASHVQHDRSPVRGLALDDGGILRTQMTGCALRRPEASRLPKGPFRMGLGVLHLPGRFIVFNRQDMLADQCAGRPTLFSAPFVLLTKG